MFLYLTMHEQVYARYYSHVLVLNTTAKASDTLPAIEFASPGLQRSTGYTYEDMTF